MSTPFDLHVLSTPPAFILSQDQTLNKMVSKERLRSSNHLIEAQFIASKKLNQEPSSSSLRLLRRTSRPFWCFVFLSRCLIYKVHAPVSFSADVLFILALTLSLVKNFFQTFLRFSASWPFFLFFSSKFPPLGANSFSLPRSHSFVKHFFQPASESPSGFRPVSSVCFPVFSCPP